MTTRTQPRGTYDTLIRSFDHGPLARHPAYARLRQALSDLANETDPIPVPAFLAAIQDMTLTAPFGDMCVQCHAMAWPHAVHRNGEHITGTYRCDQGHTWTCGYSVSIVGAF